MVENFGEPGSFDAVVFLQTIEHVFDPPAVLAHHRSLLAAGGTVYVSTPNLLTLAPEGAEKSGEPLAHQGVPGRGVPASVRLGVPDRCRCSGSSTRAGCALHELALSLGWDRAPSRARDHRPLLRPLHARDRDERLRAAPDELDRALDFLAVCR